MNASSPRQVLLTRLGFVPVREYSCLHMPTNFFSGRRHLIGGDPGQLAIPFIASYISIQYCLLLVIPAGDLDHCSAASSESQLSNTCQQAPPAHRLLSEAGSPFTHGQIAATGSLGSATEQSFWVVGSGGPSGGPASRDQTYGGSTLSGARPRAMLGAPVNASKRTSQERGSRVGIMPMCLHGVAGKPLARSWRQP